jgi:hypothetical protein
MKTLISGCGQYRYLLSRDGDLLSTRGPAVFVLLNPSTADAKLDDPTIRRCRSFANVWGCNGIRVLNLYALRSTDPRALWKHLDPIGPDNDRWLAKAAGTANEIVCAWGVNAPLARVDAVVSMLVANGASLKCLGTAKGGAPRHPLYVPSSQALVEWGYNGPRQ